MAPVATRIVQWHEDKEDETSEVRLSLEEHTDDESRGSVDILPIQQHSRPATPVDVAFERDVLVLPNGKTEKELDEHYRLAARDLGLDLGDKKRRKDAEEESHQDTSSSALTTASSVRDSFSHASQSTPPTSCDSSERQTTYAYPPKTPTRHYVPPSITPSRQNSRPPSVLSSKSITSSIRSGLRRLSSFGTKHKSNDLSSNQSSASIYSNDIASSPATPRNSRRPSTSHSTVVPQTPSTRASNTSFFSSYHNNIPPQLGPPQSPMSTRTPRPLSRGQSLPSIVSSSAASTHSNRTTNFSTPLRSPRAKSSDTRTLHSYRPLSPTREEGFSLSNELAAAQARTTRNRDLQRIRAGQLAEQGRFLAFQREQYMRLQSKHNERVRANRKLWKEREQIMERAHAEREAEVEGRQLTAELDLTRTMEAERRAVEARLRHMEGYVNGRGIYDPSGARPSTTHGILSKEVNAMSGTTGNVGGGTGPTGGGGGLHLTPELFPARHVSSHSLQLLAQQYRLRSQLPQLHAAKINVLRETQAKQLERLQMKQTLEHRKLHQEMLAAEAELKKKLEDGEAEMKKAFENRKQRMQWRWKITEEMDRRRLMEERGVMFAAMPSVIWGAEAWKGQGNG